MYKCVDCEAIFEDPATWEEDRGEFWGVPCTERVSGCPKCKGDYDEAFECRGCGEWLFEEELTDGFCEICHDKIFG